MGARSQPEHGRADRIIVNIPYIKKQRGTCSSLFAYNLSRRRYSESVAAIHSFDVEGERVFLCAAHFPPFGEDIFLRLRQRGRVGKEIFQT